MDHVVLVIHLIVALVLIILVMLQRSEGGGLGLGGNGGLGNLASVQSTANALTKITTYVAMGFFVTSIILAIMASHRTAPESILDKVAADKPAIEVPLATSTDPVEDKADKKSAAKEAEKTSQPPTVPIAK